MELCFNEMTVMKTAHCRRTSRSAHRRAFSAVELRKGTLLRYLRGGGTLEALRQTLEEQHVRAASLNARLRAFPFRPRAAGRMLRELSDWCFAARRVLGCGCMEVIVLPRAGGDLRGGDLPRDRRFAAAALGRRGGLRRAAGAGIYGGAGQPVQTFAQCAEILEAGPRQRGCCSTPGISAPAARDRRSCRLCAATGSLWSMSATARRAPCSRRSARRATGPARATPLGGAAAERPGDRLRRPLLRRGHGPECAALPAGMLSAARRRR